MAGSCLQLVAKLLNYTKNPQAELYNRVFSRQDKQLIRAMKLENFISTPGSERLFTTEAMSLLDTYLSKNPKINDIRMLMNDDIACDKFRRWTIVRKNCKDMGFGESKKSSLGRSSFRRSKNSFFSGIAADEDTLGDTFRKYNMGETQRHQSIEDPDVPLRALAEAQAHLLATLRQQPMQYSHEHVCGQFKFPVYRTK